MRCITIIAIGVAGATLLGTAPLGAQPDDEHGEPGDSTATKPSADVEAPDPGDQPAALQLVSVAHVTLAVSDRARATRALVALSREVGGTPPGRSGDGVELHVPREQVVGVLGRVRKLGTELNRHAEVRDVSGELADLASQITSTTAARQRVIALRGHGRSTDDALLIERQLDQLDGQLAELRLERGKLQRQVDYATVEVTLVVEGPATPETVPEPRLPFDWLQRTGLGPLQHPPPASQPRQREVIDSMLDGGLQAELSYLDGLPGREEPSWAAVGALRFRGNAPGWPVGLAMGFDAGLGGGNGFVYDLDLLLGVGSSAARWVSFGLVSGAAGRSWSGGRVPAAWEVPAELYVNFQFGEAGRLLLQARPQWIGPRIEARQDGSSVGFADELVLRGTLELAPLLGRRDMSDGALRLGVAYHELRDTRLWTFVLGWGAGEVETRGQD